VGGGRWKVKVGGEGMKRYLLYESIGEELRYKRTYQGIKQGSRQSHWGVHPAPDAALTPQGMAQLGTSCSTPASTCVCSANRKRTMKSRLNGGFMAALIDVQTSEAFLYLCLFIVSHYNVVYYKGGIMRVGARARGKLEDMASSD